MNAASRVRHSLSDNPEHRASNYTVECSWHLFTTTHWGSETFSDRLDSERATETTSQIAEPRNRAATVRERVSQVRWCMANLRSGPRVHALRSGWERNWG